MILGDLGTYGGRITVDSTNGGVVRATHSNSFGIYGGTTQSGTFISTSTTGATSNGTVEFDGSAGSFTTQESFYLGMRTTENQTTHIRNVAGNNTITGFVSLNNPTSGTNLNVFNSAYMESVAGKLTFQGSISNDRTLAGNPSTTFLYFKGNGDFELGGGVDGGIYNNSPTTFVLNVDKTGTGTVTIVPGLNPVNNWAGTTTIHAGKWIVNAIHNTAGAAAYTVENGGTVGGSGYVASGVTINPGGTLAPGAGLGAFAVGSAMFNTDSTNFGKLQIEYNNASSPKIDKLIVTGNLDITNAIVDFQNLGGTLTGAAHVFASYGSLTGTAFASVLNLPAGYVINYNYVGGVQGDYNNNGVVDAADYVVWRKNNGSNTYLPNEVIDATPGQVTIDDYDAWRSRFGNTTPSGNQIALVPAGSGSGSLSAAVPEPSSLALVGSLASLLIVKRRSRMKPVFVPHVVTHPTL